MDATRIADLLRYADDVHPYYLMQEQVRLELNKDVVVISDLHIARGRQQSGNYSGTENFFYDEELERFLTELKRDGRSKALVINGDFVDFLRVTETPEPNEIASWSDLLDLIGIPQPDDQLTHAISKKERTYGLKTDDYKSAWKLREIYRGHTAVFEALATWIADGNDLIITKGNHDLEWIWQPVRSTLRLILAEIIADNERSELGSVIDRMSGRVWFIDKALVIDNELYIEHGHRYDKFCVTVPTGEDILPGGKELNIPFGSFFNRYLVNKIELSYPYYDNVRPRGKLFPMLLRERLPLAIKLLVLYIPFLFLSIRKRLYFFMFAKPLIYLLLLGIPLGFLLYNVYLFIWPSVESAQSAVQASAVGAFALERVSGLAQGVLMMALGYLFSRILAYLQLEEPSSLSIFAQKKMEEMPGIRYFTMGHTHFPEQFVSPAGQQFFNTGTWIPIVEASSAALHHERTFCVLRFRKDAEGTFADTLLERWNDDAGRIDIMPLTTEKQTRIRRARRAMKRARLKLAGNAV